MKFEWPTCNQYNFESYEIEASQLFRSIRKTIRDADSNIYIDSLYVGGDYSFRVSCRVTDNHTRGEYVTLKESPPEMNIQELGYDSLKITWNKSPYNAMYRLVGENYYPRYFDSAEDTFCILPQAGLGNYNRFSLCAKSQYDEDWPDLSYACHNSTHLEYYLGTRIIGINSPEFAYNSIEKVFYSNSYSEMHCYDINTYSIFNTIGLNNLGSQGLFSCPTNSSKVATISKDNIYVFDNQNLLNPIVIDYNISGAYTIDHFLLSNNNKVAFATDGIYRLLDVETKQTIVSIDITDYPYYSKWACISTSQNAKYMCVATRNGIKINNIENGEISEVFFDGRSYKSVYFNPLNPDQLFITLADNPILEIRNSSSFELLDEIVLPSEMVIRNIDPETNNLLLTDYKKLFIVDIETQNILLQVPCYEYKSWLYKNNLFTNSGYVLNVSKDL